MLREYFARAVPSGGGGSSKNDADLVRFPAEFSHSKFSVTTIWRISGLDAPPLSAISIL
jgi:hypothetical protein